MDKLKAVFCILECSQITPILTHNHWSILSSKEAKTHMLLNRWEEEVVLLN